MKSVLKNVRAVFERDIQEPFYYDLTINDVSNTKGLFDKVSEIYKTGLITLYGTGNTIKIKDIKYKDLETMNKYMLSFGIEVNYKKITDYEKTQYYKYLLDEVVKLEEVNINVILDWKSQNIKSSELKIIKRNKNETFDKIYEIMKNHLLICQLTNFLGLNFNKDLKHYAMVYKFQNESHIISFDFANMGKYCKAVSYITRHKYLS
jgi:hypothetical protein